MSFYSRGWSKFIHVSMSSRISSSWDWRAFPTSSRIVIENRTPSGPTGMCNWGALVVDPGITITTYIQTPNYEWDWSMFSRDSAIAGVHSTMQPLRPLNGHKQVKNEEYNGEEIDCSMCLESIKQRSSIYRLSCGHKFHSNKCINNGNVIDWIRAHGTCPYCRAKTEL